MIVDTSKNSSEFIFYQATPSSEWIINHNLGCYPSVTVIDSSGRQVEGGVSYETINKIKIEFSGGFSGKAILR